MYMARVRVGSGEAGELEEGEGDGGGLHLD